MTSKSNKALDLLVEDLYRAGIELLLERVRSREATPTDIKTIRDLARDHGVQKELPEVGSAIDDMELPFDKQGRLKIV